jgi:hypothetical protein
LRVRNSLIAIEKATFYYLFCYSPESSSFFRCHVMREKGIDLSANKPKLITNHDGSGSRYDNRDGIQRARILPYSSNISYEDVILTAFFNIPPTEQYFSSESLIALSTASSLMFFPLMMYLR